jgi:hypothetical protein
MRTSRIAEQPWIEHRPRACGALNATTRDSTDGGQLSPQPAATSRIADDADMPLISLMFR